MSALDVGNDVEFLFLVKIAQTDFGRKQRTVFAFDVQVPPMPHRPYFRMIVKRFSQAFVGVNQRVGHQQFDGLTHHFGLRIPK
jgi:hypothetical protein